MYTWNYTALHSEEVKERKTNVPRLEQEHAHMGFQLHEVASSLVDARHTGEGSVGGGLGLRSGGGDGGRGCMARGDAGLWILDEWWCVRSLQEDWYIVKW
jgi:uncharacterized membrane protein